MHSLNEVTSLNKFLSGMILFFGLCNFLLKSSTAEILKIRSNFEQNSYKEPEDFIDKVILPLKDEGIKIAAAYTASLKAQEGQASFLENNNLEV